MEHERLVAIGGYFDGKLMPPTAVGLPELRMPIRESINAEALVRDVPVVREVRVESYVRGEMTAQEKVFAFWMAKDETYASVMRRLLDRYVYEKD